MAAIQGTAETLDVMSINRFAEMSQICDEIIGYDEMELDDDEKRSKANIKYEIFAVCFQAYGQSWHHECLSQGNCWYPIEMKW